MDLSKEERELKKSFDNEQERLMYQLLITKWLCDAYPDLGKYMSIILRFFNKKFGTKSLPLKNSRAHELIKEWEIIGLIKRVDIGSKLHEYKFIPTLFAKAIELRQLEPNKKQLILKMIDELIEV